MTKFSEIVLATGFIVIITIKSVEIFMSYSIWSFKEYGYLAFFIVLVILYVWFMIEKHKEMNNVD